ncbi:MAG: sensor histidine kinase, partial [Halanaerobiales bacterium]
MISYFMTRNIVKPVQKIKNRAHRMAEGDLSVRLKKLPGDEIGDLGKSFNYMAEALEESMDNLNMEKNRMKNMLTSMSEGVLAVAANDKTIILANPIFYKIFDKNESIVGNNFKKSLPSELIELIKKVLEEGKQEKREFSWREKVITAQAAPVYKNEDKLWGSILLIRDVTEIRKLAEMKELFVANVSHELKTPLTAIRGYLEAILDGMIEDTDKKRKYLKKVLKETDRMSRMAGEVLELSKLQSGQIDFDFKEVNLRKIIDSVLSTFSGRFGQREVKVNCPEDIMVMADRDRVEQVFINLL